MVGVAHAVMRFDCMIGDVCCCPLESGVARVLRRRRLCRRGEFGRMPTGPSPPSFRRSHWPAKVIHFAETHHLDSNGYDEPTSPITTLKSYSHRTRQQDPTLVLGARDVFRQDIPRNGEAEMSLPTAQSRSNSSKRRSSKTSHRSAAVEDPLFGAQQ